jgi:hypothetical protein
LVSISIFLLISGLPFSFGFKSVICVVSVYKNPMPSSIIDAIMWTLQIIIEHHHHCRCPSRRTLLILDPLPLLSFYLFMFTSHHRRNQWQWWCWWKRRWMTLTPCDALALKKISTPNSTTKLYTET